MNATNYLGNIIAMVRKMTNDQDGISEVVATTETAIASIDEDVTILMAQRDDLTEIYEGYVGLYQKLVGEELRTSREMQQVTTIRGAVSDAEAVRQRVLPMADHIQDRTQFKVTAARIAERLEKESGELPWKNPHAVIATILSRSSQWQKSEEGHYTRVEEEQEDISF